MLKEFVNFVKRYGQNIKLTENDENIKTIDLNSVLSEPTKFDIDEMQLVFDNVNLTEEKLLKIIKLNHETLEKIKFVYGYKQKEEIRLDNEIVKIKKEILNIKETEIDNEDFKVNLILKGDKMKKGLIDLKIIESMFYRPIKNNILLLGENSSEKTEKEIIIETNRAIIKPLNQQVEYIHFLFTEDSKERYTVYIKQKELKAIATDIQFKTNTLMRIDKNIEEIRIVSMSNLKELLIDVDVYSNIKNPYSKKGVMIFEFNTKNKCKLFLEHNFTKDQFVIALFNKNEINNFFYSLDFLKMSDELYNNYENKILKTDFIEINQKGYYCLVVLYETNRQLIKQPKLFII